MRAFRARRRGSDEGDGRGARARRRRGGRLVLVRLDARTRAIGLGRQACERDHLQFLDETVLCTRTRPARDADGRVRLRRMYRFEFSDDGMHRRAGRLVLLGDELETLELDPFLM